MSIVNSANINPVPCQNQVRPGDGAKELPIRLDWSDPVNGAVSPATFDYSSEQQRSLFSLCQGVYIDNGLNGNSLTITVGVGGQVLTCPANSQGYFPLLCPNPINLTFTTQGNVLTFVFLLNFPVAPCVWHV